MCALMCQSFHVHFCRFCLFDLMNAIFYLRQIRVEFLLKKKSQNRADDSSDGVESNAISGECWILAYSFLKKHQPEFSLSYEIGFGQISNPNKKIRIVVLGVRSRFVWNWCLNDFKGVIHEYDRFCLTELRISSNKFRLFCWCNKYA